MPVLCSDMSFPGPTPIYIIWEIRRMMITYEHLTEITPEISELYASAFSEIEKVPEENLLRTFGRGGKLIGYYDDGEFIGFTFSFSDEDRTFWVYFATSPERRSMGYGSRIIPILREILKGQRIFLVIEPRDPDAEDIDIRVRRHDFYIRSGCSDSGCQVISDDAWFDTMFVQGELTEMEMRDTVRLYEDIHNGRS